MRHRSLPRSLARLLPSLIAAIGLSAACAAPAFADVVTFNQFGKPDIYSAGDVLTSIDGTQTITVLGQGGFDGAIVNGSDPESCSVAACPGGNTGGYYAALNDGGFRFEAAKSFYLDSIDFAFISPIDILLDFSVGRLVITGSDGNTVSREFSLQQNGVFGFTNWNIGGIGLIDSATVFACLYDGTGACVNPALNQAQFAVDNLSYTLPEPGSMTLGALALAALVAARRRKAQ
jgi:hypothetical protein